VYHKLKTQYLALATWKRAILIFWLGMAIAAPVYFYSSDDPQTFTAPHIDANNDKNKSFPGGRPSITEQYKSLHLKKTHE
jgi:hypothetical protein